jgi:CelD/BcsL family acetyltransferase involved in cellulose biosynthesis
MAGIEPIQIEMIKGMEGLVQYEKKWNRLCEKSGQSLPVNSYAWMSSFFEHRLKEKESNCTLFAWRQGELIGALPLVLSRANIFGTAFHIARTPGDEHTIPPDIAVVGGAEEETIPLLLNRAIESIPHLLSIEMNHLRADSPTLRSLSRNGAEYRILDQSDGLASYIPIDGDFEKFRAGLSKNFRHNLSKQARKLNKLSGVRYVTVWGTDGLEENLKKFMVIEAAGWKGRERTAILNFPDLVAFYSTLTGRLGEEEWLEWEFLHGEDRVLAANLTVRFKRKLGLWKIAYDEKYAECAPGNILFERLFKDSFEKGEIGEIDLITDMEWHKNWNVEKRSFRNVKIFPATTLANIFGYIPGRFEKELRGVKRRLKRIVVDKVRRNPKKDGKIWDLSEEGVGAIESPGSSKGTCGANSLRTR